MFGLKSRYRVHENKNGDFLFETSFIQRLIYALICLTMVSVGFFGSEPLFSMKNIVGSIIYLVLCLLCFLTAIYRDSFVFSKKKGVAVRTKTLLWIRFFKKLELKLSQIDSILLYSIVVRPGDSPLQKKSFSLFPPRKTKYFYKLFIQVEGTLYLLEDASELKSLEIAGKSLAEYLDVNFIQEEH